MKTFKFLTSICLSIIFALLLVNSLLAQTVIDFETANDGYASSATEGSGDTDVFNRSNPDIGGNSTYLWAVEDISLTDPSITLDQIDITGSTSFTFSVDFLTPNSNDWDSTDELIITYSIDGGAYQNLMCIQSNEDGDSFNAPAAIDADFDGTGDDGQELPAITDGFGAGVGSNFATFSTGDIALSGNSTLDITLQFNGLTAGDEGIYLDNITITQVSGSSGPSITSISHTPASPTSSDPVSVSADITDADGIFGAEIHWGTSSGSLGNTISMSNSGGNTYTTDSDIPAQSNGTTVYYEVYALDNVADETTSIEQSYTVTDPATIPYTEDFTGQDGKGATGTSSGTITDLAGVDWTVDVGGTLETDGTTNQFEVVSGEFSGIDVDGSAYWYTPVIDVSSVNAIDLSIDLDVIGGGANASGENITVYYTTNPSSGSPTYTSVASYDQNNDSGLPQTITQNNIDVSGATEFGLRVEIDANGSGDGFSFDNISLTETVLNPDDPDSFTATAFSATQINLSAIANGSGDDILVAYNSSSTFGTPVDGSSYVAGNSIPGGGTVLYTGDASSLINHTGLSAGQTVYYKVWSVNGSDLYSSGITDNATTTTNPVIVVSPSVLTGFTYDQGTGPSLEQTFLINGSNLTGDISITAPTNYEISETSGSGFGNTITLSPSGGTISSTTIYVRLLSGLGVNTYNGEDINITSPGATSQTVTCSGEVTCPSLSAPIATAGTSVAGTGFTANWNPVAGADGYYIDIYSLVGGIDISTDGTGISTDPYSVSQALALPESSTEYFVKGYIVGRGNPISFGIPAANDYSVLLAENANETNPSNVIVAKIESADRPSWGLATNPLLYQTGVKLEGYRDNYGGDPSVEGASQWEAVSGGVPSYYIQNLDVGNVTSFGVSPLTPGTVYFYVVRAYNSCGSTSASSNEIQVDLPSIGFVWTGAIDTDWNNAGNWSENAVPGSDDDVSIPSSLSNYPVVGSSSSADCNDLTIESGASLTIQSGGSFIPTGTVTNNGTMTAQLYVTGGSTSAGDYTWHGITLPTNDASAGTYFTGDYVYAYDESGNTWENIVPTSTILQQGEGYLVKTVNGNKTYSFSGTLNNGSYTFNISNSGADVEHGYNYVGNPYPSYIDLQTVSGSNISPVFYAWNGSSTYISYNISTHTGALGQYLHPMQGIFVKILSGNTSGNISMENSDRTHNSGSFYKSEEDAPDYLSIQVSGNGYADKLFIHHFEQENYGYKLFSMNPNVPQIFAQDQDYEFCMYNIHGEPAGASLPIGFTCDNNGTYTLSLSHNDFSGEYNLVIEDRLTGEFTPISAGEPVEFDYAAGSTRDRFMLHFNSPTDIQNSQIVDYLVRGERGQIQVNTYGSKAQIAVYDLHGRKIENMHTNGHFTEIPLATAGMYIVKISSNSKVQTEKVIVK